MLHHLTKLALLSTLLLTLILSSQATAPAQAQTGVEFVGQIDMPGYAYAYGVQVSGNYAYVAAEDGGLQIIDISNPTVPKLIGNYATQDRAIDIYMSGNYAYVAAGDSGLYIINVSNPAIPKLTGIYDTPEYAYGVYVSGNYAYVADEDSGLQIIDVSNPETPKLTGSYNTSGWAHDVYVIGNYAYVADYDGGLKVINISNKATPKLVKSYNTPDDANGVYVSGNYAYVAHDSGLQIINISNPTFPTLIGSYEMPNGYAHRVYVLGNYAYVADGSRGLQIISVSNPASPTLVGSHGTSAGGANDVYVIGDYVYVADENGGLSIFRFNSGTTNLQLQVSPTSLTFSNQELNTSSTAQSITLKNSGTSDVTISSIITSGDFAQTNNCGTALTAGASCTVNVTFKPTATGNRTGTLTVMSNATGSPHTVSLTGTGVDPTPTKPPTISNINVVALSSTSVRITWQTDILADSYVDYGNSTQYGSVVKNTTKSTTHSLDLTNLTAYSAYYFKISSWNGVGSATDPANPNNARLESYFKVYRNSTLSKDVAVWGAIYDKYELLGNTTGNLGAPKSPEEIVTSGASGISGRLQLFQNGAIVLHKSGSYNGQVFASWGVVDDKYYQLGSANGSLGFPISDTSLSNGTSRLTLEKGQILCTGSSVASCNIVQLEVQIATPYQEVWHGEAIPIMVTVKDNNALVSGASVTVGIGSYGKINLEEVVDSPGIYKGRLTIHGPTEMPPGNYTLEVQAESNLNGQTKIGHATTSLTVSKATNVMEDPTLKVTCPASLVYVGMTCEIMVNAVFPNNAIYNNAQVELDLLHASGSKTISLKPTGQNNSWSGSYQFTQAGSYYLEAHLFPPRETKILPTWKMGSVGVLVSPNPIVGEWVSKPVGTVFKRYQSLKFQVKFTHDGQPATDKMLKAYLMRPGKEYELYPTDTPGVYDTTIQFNYSGDYELEVGIESQYERTYPAPIKFTISNEIEDGVKQTKELLQETRDLISELEKWQFKLAENGDKFEDELKKVSTGGERRTAKILSKTLDTGVSCVWSEAEEAWNLVKFIYTGGEVIAESAEGNKLGGDALELLGQGASVHVSTKYIDKESIMSMGGEYILDDMSQKGVEAFTERQLTLIGEAIDASRKQETAFLRNSYYQKYKQFNAAKLKLLTDIEFEAKFVEQWSTMNQATKEAWLEDIKLRREANRALKEMMVTDAKFIQHLKEAFEDSKDSFFDTAINISKFAVPKLVKLYNPALGIAVDCGLKSFDATVALLDDSEVHRYELAIQTARSGIDGIDKTITQITMNSTSAVAGITLKETPQTPDADITIANDACLEGKLVGILPFKQTDPTAFARKTSVGIKIENNSSIANDTQFMVMSKYSAIEERRSLLGYTVWDSDTEVARGHLGEDAYLVKVAPQGSKEKRFYFSDIDKRLYLQPSKGTNARFYLFATNSKGVWLVGNEKKEIKPSWCPFGKQKQTTPITDTIQMVVPYPIVMSIREQDNSMLHLVTIEVYNPLPDSLAGTVSQIIPVGVTVSGKGSGNLENNVISWVDNIPSKGWRTYQYTVTVSSNVTYSPATLKMYLPATDNYENFDSNSEEVNPHVALIASSGLSSGKITSDVFRVPVTVTNLSSSSVSGHITVILKDNLGNHVITHTQIVSLPGNKVELINLDVDTTSLNKGSYNILGELNSNNKSSYFIMGKVEKIDASELIHTYLPLIIKAGSSSGDETRP